ncbi:MAG TPA: DUF3052 domain-containing protein [Caulobacteraceae bacterium]|jgi:hypothetical protein|nr:DUF3052 domain-containing protein [Caulobacteraceae bacterium]
MGKEARVEAFWPAGGGGAGRLQYEPPELIFRGDERRVFDAAALAGVRAEGHDLVLLSGERFRLPSPAASWAEAILNPKGRLEKLGVKAESRVRIVGLDDPEFAAELTARVPGAIDGPADLVFYGADSAEDLARIGALLPDLAPRGALWIVSLKGKAARVRDVQVMAAAKAVGLVDSKVCAFSATRTALRFVRRRT